MAGTVVWIQDSTTGNFRPAKSSDFGGSSGGGVGFPAFQSLSGATGSGPGLVYRPSGNVHSVWSMQVVVSGFTGAVVALELSLNGSTFAEVGRFDLSTNPSGSLLTFYPHAAVSARLNVLSVSGTGTIDGWIGVV